MEPLVFTLGHSTRSLDDFIALLTAHGVERLVDVRTVPRSRHNPQFNRDTLPQALQAAGIGYVHMAGLGGLRKPRADSVNAGWRNLSFRGYADHMQSAEFAQSLAELMASARKQQLALMCAEAVPWRCHRSLIGDALLVHGVPVEEIVDAKRREPHRLTPFAVVDATTITYPSADAAEPHQTELFPPPPGSAPTQRRLARLRKS
ncbi:MAG: DUF488 family protein [Betaproteobacteria bacterium]|nr:DUF488 family protein [Betaproteobacteria bacterium]